MRAPSSARSSFWLPPTAWWPTRYRPTTRRQWRSERGVCTKPLEGQSPKHWLLTYLMVRTFFCSFYYSSLVSSADSVCLPHWGAPIFALNWTLLQVYHGMGRKSCSMYGLFWLTVRFTSPIIHTSEFYALRHQTYLALAKHFTTKLTLDTLIAFNFK